MGEDKTKTGAKDESAPESGQQEEDKLENAVQRYRERAITPLSAIRAFCVSCQGGYVQAVNKCGANTCPLHPYRMGTNPNHGRVGQPNPTIALINVSRRKSK